MKKILCILFCLWAENSMAQKDLNVGFFSGVSLSSIEWYESSFLGIQNQQFETVRHEDLHLGTTFGFNFEVDQSKTISWMAKLSYYQIGGSEEYFFFDRSGNRNTARSYISFNYLALNPALRLKIRSSKHEYHWDVSPRVEYLVVPGILWDQDLNRFNYGFNTGIGGAFYLTDYLDLTTDISYGLRFNDILREDSDQRNATIIEANANYLLEVGLRVKIVRSDDTN